MWGLVRLWRSGDSSGALIVAGLLGHFASTPLLLDPGSRVFAATIPFISLFFAAGIGSFIGVKNHFAQPNKADASFRILVNITAVVLVLLIVIGPLIARSSAYGFPTKSNFPKRVDKVPSE